MLFTVLVCAAGFVAGTIASVAGFGIGSLLTPLFATRVGERFLRRVPEHIFRMIVSLVVLALAVTMLAAARITNPHR